MAVYTVYTHFLSTRYRSTLCSKSTFFLILLTFWTFFIPLLIAYRSQGFWVKDASYREQPTIRFKYKYFILMETDNENEPIICTSLHRYSTDLEDFNRCTLVRTNEYDYNGDGKLDTLHMEVDTILDEGVFVKSLFFIMGFDYILQHQCLLQMESLGIIQASASLPSSKFHITADLQLIQKSLLNCRGRDLRFNETLLTDDETSDMNMNIDDLISSYAERNITTKLENVYSTWTRRSDSQDFKIIAHINYPEVTVHYKPGFWPMMKWAWIQYLAILVIFLAVCRWVKGYVFLNRLLPTVPDKPWRKLKLE